MRIRAASLVGRSAELAVLHDVIVDTPSGGSAVFVLGEAGIGKSRLIAEMTTAAYAAGMTVLRGRTGTVGPPVPYRPLAEALMSLAREGAPDDPELGPYRAVLGRLVPEWRTPEGGDGPVSPLVLAEAVIRLTGSVGASGGCLLVLEDLHDADVETLAVVEYLADNLAHQPTSLVATARVEDGAALDLVTGIARRPDCTLVELERLTREGCDELVSVCLGLTSTAELPDGIGGRLWDDSAGNPFVVEELLRHMVASGRLDQGERGWRLHPVPGSEVPTSMVRRITQRAERLGERGADVLAAAAVLGRRFPVSVLQQMLRVDDRTLLVHLRAALTAQLVAPDDTEPDWYAFQHGLTADALIATLSPAERTRLHRAAADAVMILHPGLPGDWCQLAARLRAGAGDIAVAAQLHLEAGARALRAGAAGSAVALLETAQAMLTTPAQQARAEHPDNTAPRAEVLTLLLYALAESGRLGRAFELAAQLDDVGLDAHRRVEVTLRLAWVAHLAGQWEAARQQVQAARTLLARDPARRLSAALQSLDACVTLESPGVDRFHRAEKLAEEALQLAEGLDVPETEAQAWHLLGQAARERDLVESERCFQHVRETAERGRLPIWRIYALLGTAGNTWLADGDATGIRTARTQAMNAGAILLAREMDGIQALHHALCGEFEVASAAVDEGLETAHRLHMGAGERYLLMVRATVAAHQLDRPRMESALAEFSAAGGDESVTAPLAVGLARVFCALLEEDRGLAMRELAVVRAAQERHESTFFLAGHHGLGLLLEEIERDDPTLSTPRRREPAGSAATSMRWNAQFALLADAVRLGRAGRPAQAWARVEEAREASHPYPLARHLGLRLVGEAAIRDGWADPQAWLRTSEEFFHGMAAPAVASACRRLLRETGASVRQRRDGAERVPAGLRARGVTVREYDVLVQLGDHLGNKEIAARLHISPRTVEKHVAGLLLKTGCTNRSELLAHLGVERGLDRTASP